MKNKLKSIFSIARFYSAAFIISIIGLLVLFFDFGFNQNEITQSEINVFYFVVLFFGLFATILRYVEKLKELKLKVIVFDLIMNLGIIALVILHFRNEESSLHLFYNDNLIKFAIFFTFIREFAAQNINFKRTFLNPAQLFIFSFIVIILFGSLLLMLPNATYNGLSFIDALFTATSAVCVTGLIVVDTSTYFTLFGQIILITLIQIGGLGILTFASYFAYFFKGGASYENQLVLSDLTNSKRLGDVFNTLKRILLITFLIEIIGAIFLFLTLKSDSFNDVYEQIYFAVFHSISSFCNAGFSTLSNGLYENEYSTNYPFQLIIIFLFVFGGLGFPIVINVVKYFKHLLLNKIFRLNKGYIRPRLVTLTSKITLITTFTLIIIGTLGFYVLEYDNTLVAHNGIGKFITALFGGTTPRTAGFNTVDMGALRFPTLLMIIFLMWIGASPASTGGGIKTSTFAIAFLNVISLAKGKLRTEIYRREIANRSIMRAFAVIFLSLLVICVGIFIISIFDSQLGLLNIAFECFSAYSTVGLTVGITSLLSLPSKLVIIAIMFIGRVSVLSIMIAIFNKVKYKNYRYPTEEIVIN